MGARVVADCLPPYRIYRGFKTAERLRTDMKSPNDRTWVFAASVLLDASTDFIDGKLARYAGATPYGGYLDQLADKVWFLKITRQLVANQELPAYTYKVPAARDAVITVSRPIAGLYGINTDADQLGKLKLTSQSLAAVAACSPISYDHPEIVRDMFGIATGMSALSGAVLMQDYVHEISKVYPDQPVVRTLGKLGLIA